MTAAVSIIDLTYCSLMFKSLNNLWLRSARQLARAQRKKTGALVKKLLVTAPSSLSVKKTNRRPAPSISSQSGVWGRATFIAGAADAVDGIALGKRMDYWLYRPSGMTAETTPLVVMLHGCEQTATDFASGTRMNRLAEQKGFGVLYPQQSAHGHSHRCWPWYRKEVLAGEGEARMIAAIMRRVVTRHHFDPTRVYLCGLSAGAAMAHILALRYPQLIAAVGLHSGPIFGAATTSAGAYGVMQRGGLKLVGGAIDKVLQAADDFPTMPAILLQGQQDTIVRPVNLHQLEQQFCHLNQLTAAQRQPHKYHPAGASARSAHAFDTVDYRVGKKTILRVCEIFQLDHAWSGGDAAYRFNARKGPDASRMMWTFFAPHRRLPRQPDGAAASRSKVISEGAPKRFGGPQ